MFCSFSLRFPAALARCVVGVLVLGSGLVRAESMFETFGGLYNSMLFGNYSAANGDTEGRQYVSGDFTLSTVGYSVGYTVVGIPNVPQAGRDDLVIGGNFLGGTISTVTENAVLGGTVISGTIGFNAADSQSSGTGTLTQNAGDFRLNLTTGNVTDDLTDSIGQSELWAAFRAESLALSQLATSEGVAVGGDPWNVTITISGDPGLKVVNLTSEQWTPTPYAGRTITVDPSAAGSTILINVDGALIDLSGGSMSLVGVDQGYVLFNYFEAETWTSQYFLHEGSVLAPFTTSVDIQGSINGSVVFAGSISKTGGAEFHNFLFRGDLSSVPEPCASVTILGGLAVLAGRRRR
jgi:choice-of-anchor A domain-containing protein